MKATKFFNVAAILFTVATSFFCASCTDEEKDEQDRMPVYVHNDQQQEQQIKSDKNIVEFYAVLGTDMYDMYDLKATYTYDGKTEVENLEYVREQMRLSRNVKIFGLVKEFDKSQQVEVILTAYLKPDAIARAEALSDTTLTYFHVHGEVQNLADRSDEPSFNTKLATVRKSEMIKMMTEFGDIELGHKIIK